MGEAEVYALDGANVVDGERLGALLGQRAGNEKVKDVAVHIVWRLPNAA